MPVSSSNSSWLRRAELDVVHLALNRREPLQRGAALVGHRQRDAPAVAGVGPLVDETELHQPLRRPP